MNKQRTHLSLVLLVCLVLMPLKLMAIEMGTITLDVGESYSIDGEAGGAQAQSGYWSVDGDAIFSITAKSQTQCTIRAYKVGTSRLKYSYSYYDSNYNYKSGIAYWTIKVEAANVLVTSITLNTTSTSLSIGGTQQLTATISPSNATNKSVLWSSDKTDIATVSSNGLVTAKGEGNATITCKANDSSDCQSTCIVTVGKSSSQNVEVPTDEWCNSGNYSISWFNKNQKEFTLSTAKELAGMAYLVNNEYTRFSGVTINLGDDIDISEKKWIPCKYFSGTFNGNNHTIKGLYVGTSSDSKTENYGFWGSLSNGATIKNLYLDGVIDLSIKTAQHEKVNSFVGGMAGSVDDKCLIENCHCFIDIKIKRIVTTSTQLYQEKTVAIGGVFGKCLNSTVSYCSHKGNIISSRSGTVSHFTIGGIAGVSNGYSRFLYCENYSDLISYEGNTNSRDEASIAGIVGESNYYIRYNMSAYSNNCRNIINSVIITTANTSYYDFPDFYISGINHSNSTNCYSVITSISAKSSSRSCKLQLAGVSRTANACFSNNDRLIDSNMKITYGNDGSTSFSSEQMKTPAFLEELNIYSILEMDGPVWTQPAEGGYPYIAALGEATAVKPITLVESKNATVYTLSGQRITTPRKGINIVGGKKVIVK